MSPRETLSFPSKRLLSIQYLYEQSENDKHGKGFQSREYALEILISSFLTAKVTRQTIRECIVIRSANIKEKESTYSENKEVRVVKLNKVQVTIRKKREYGRERTMNIEDKEVQIPKIKYNYRTKRSTNIEQKEVQISNGKNPKYRR